MKRISTRFPQFVPVSLLTRKAGFTALALAAPLMAMTAAFALAGTVPSSNLEGSTTATASVTEAVSTDASMHDQTSTEADASGTSTTQPTAQITTGATATTGATVTPTTAQEGTAEARDAHTNGHGCDDVLFSAAATPGPGGPVGCTVGNSGPHRQNGLAHGANSATATATATGTASASPSASPSPDATVQGPHANGKGCDDVLFAAGRTPAPGGPIGCTVGNSGGHRQNGLHGNVAATASPSAAAAGSTSTTPVMDSTTTGRGHGPANGHGKH